MKELSEPYRLQMLFDKMATHLLTQMESSEIDDTNVYRGPCGLKCPVGSIITDEFYSPELEGKEADEDSVVMAVGRSVGFTLNPTEIKLLMEAQKIHDFSAPFRWVNKLRALAEKNFLSFRLHQLRLDKKHQWKLPPRRRT